MNDKKILIAGGDLRQIYCGKYISDKFADKFDVYFTGFDRQYISENLKYADLKNFNDFDLFDIIIFPVPPLQDDLYINAPFSKNKIPVSYIKKFTDENTLIFAGKTDDKFINIFSNNTVCDYLKREELNILNAVPTAEGAVSIALEEMPITLMGSKVLITGFGRIGKALVNILKGFGADITIMTKSVESRAWAKLMNTKICTKEEIDSSFNLIFNTAPVLIFDSETLKQLGSDTILIDLASKPGGIDFKSARDIGIKVIWALGLPGKSAPITSGEIIAQTIQNIIHEIQP